MTDEDRNNVKVDVHAEAAKLFEPVVAWEEAGVRTADIFHIYAQAFGTALSRYCEPDVAVAFLKQEIGRIQLLHAGPETRQ